MNMLTDVNKTKLTNDIVFYDDDADECIQHQLMRHSPLLAPSMSIMRPGVQTMISAPRFSSAICGQTLG